MNNLKITLSPFAKAVAAAIVALVTLIAQCISSGVIDSSSLITFIGGIGSVIAVYQATNKTHTTKTDDTGSVG